MNFAADATRCLMFDLSKPIGAEVIIGSIAFIFIIIGIGLLTVKYYEKRYIKEQK